MQSPPLERRLISRGPGFWRLSGIDRPVSIYAAPKVRIRDFFAKASLDKSYSKGVFDIDVDIENLSGKSVDDILTVQIFDGSRRIVSTMKKKVNLPEGNTTVSFGSRPVGKVKAWSAETPDLYRLVISLGDRETAIADIGFRKVEIKTDSSSSTDRPSKCTASTCTNITPPTATSWTPPL